MAFFKLRIPGRNATANAGHDAISATPAQSVEIIRKRARHRLIGAVVLVLTAVVGLPLIFDSQPRPVAVDTPIVIPDRNRVAPLTNPGVVAKAPALAVPVPVPVPVPAPASVPLPVPSPVASTAAPNPAATPAPLPASAALDANEEVVGKSPTKDAAPSPVKAKPQPKSDGDKAKALLDGKDSPKAADGAARLVVQVGAFADESKAKEARAKVEKVGLKTYTQDVETKEGKRTRVRVGPFASKEEADKAAEKIRKLNLPTTVLKL